MATAKTILLSIGFIKKKEKGDPGSRKNQTEKRNIGRKAQGKKERSVRSLTRSGKNDTERSDTKRAFISLTRGTAVASIKSVRKGNPRYCF